MYQIKEELCIFTGSEIAKGRIFAEIFNQEIYRILSFD